MRKPIVPTSCSRLAVGLVLIFTAISQAQLSGIAWKAEEQIKQERGNSIKHNTEGFVTEVTLEQLPSGFMMGQLEVFPRLESVEIDSRYYFQDSMMGGVRKLKNLRKFCLRNSRYASNATLELLAEAPALESLVLEECSDITNLHDVSKIRKLKHIAVIPDEAMSFKPLVECKNLSSIRLSDSRLINDESIREFARLKTLETVDLSGTAISDEGLAELGKAPNLRALILKECELVTGIAFAEFQFPLVLQTLNLEGATGITDEGLAGLERFAGLEHLRLERNQKVKGSGFNCLAAMKKLKTLHCPNTAITNEHLLLLDGIKTLESIWLPGCRKVSGRGVDCLTKSKSCRKLNLNLCKNIDSPDFEVLVKFGNLEELHVAGTRIRNNNIELLCRLEKLKVLDISDNNWLDDEAFQKLGNCAATKLVAKNLPRLTDAAFDSVNRMKHIEQLSVTASRKLTGLGLKSLVGNEKIRRLVFKSPQFLSLEGLGFLRQIPNLEELHFSSGVVSVTQLEQLAGMKNLRKLTYDVEDAESGSERLISILGTFPKLD